MFRLSVLTWPVCHSWTILWHTHGHAQNSTAEVWLESRWRVVQLLIPWTVAILMSALKPRWWWWWCLFRKRLPIDVIILISTEAIGPAQSAMVHTGWLCFLYPLANPLNRFTVFNFYFALFSMCASDSSFTKGHHFKHYSDTWKS